MLQGDTSQLGTWVQCSWLRPCVREKYQCIIYIITEQTHPTQIFSLMHWALFSLGKTHPHPHPTYCLATLYLAIVHYQSAPLWGQRGLPLSLSKKPPPLLPSRLLAPPLSSRPLWANLQPAVALALHYHLRQAVSPCCLPDISTATTTNYLAFLEFSLGTLDQLCLLP